MTLQRHRAYTLADLSKASYPDSLVDSPLRKRSSRIPYTDNGEPFLRCVGFCKNPSWYRKIRNTQVSQVLNYHESEYRDIQKARIQAGELKTSFVQFDEMEITVTS